MDEVLYGDHGTLRNNQKVLIVSDNRSKNQYCGSRSDFVLDTQTFNSNF